MGSPSPRLPQTLLAPKAQSSPSSIAAVTNTYGRSPTILPKIVQNIPNIRPLLLLTRIRYWIRVEISSRQRKRGRARERRKRTEPTEEGTRDEGNVRARFGKVRRLGGRRRRRRPERSTDAGAGAALGAGRRLGRAAQR